MFLFFISLAFGATSDQVCEDLYRLSCAPGEYNDGTGVSRTLGAIADLKEITAYQELAKSKLEETLKKPEKSYFRKLLLSVSGLALNPKCEGAADRPSADCLKLMVDGGSDMVINKIWNANENSALQNMSHSSTLEENRLLAENSDFKAVESSVLLQLQKSLGGESEAKRVEEVVFPRVKAQILKKIEAFVRDPKVRKDLTDKVKAIKYNGGECSSDLTGSQNAPGILLANAFYDPKRNTFKFCQGYGRLSTSEFKMAYIIAHELSHSLDPCNITVGPRDFRFSYPPKITRAQAETLYPFEGVVGCLRGVGSLQATSQLDYKVPNPYGAGNYQYSSGQTAPPGGYYGYYVPYPQQASTGGPPPDPMQQPFVSYCQPPDQITEAFPDWMATEILPDYMAEHYPQLTKDQFRIGYSNVWRGSCSASRAGTFEVHPETSLRNNNMINVHPKIRAQMGCGPDIGEKVYCPIQGVVTQPDGKSPEGKSSPSSDPRSQK
ncbi:MAG: hypothetical protein AB7F86_03395 [Bdellovibrionales bacterium]